MPENLRKSIAEAVGAFTLIFIGAGSIVANDFSAGAVGLLGIALAHGLAIATMVSATGHISGGHLNPAVTIGFLVTRRMPVITGIFYIVAQLIGATVAALLLRIIFPEASWQAVSLGTPLVSDGISVAGAILVEFVMTFFLVFVIFGTAGDPMGPKGIAGLGIGAVVTLDILMGGPLTGAAMNPARTFGPALVGGYWTNHIVYWIGPVLGAIAAATLYYFMLQKKEDSASADAA